MVDRMHRNASTFPARRGLLLGGGALALGASGLFGCDTDFTPIRFRETLSFNVDGQIRTGSSVMEYRSWQQHGNIDGNLSGSANKGQAIIVDLGKGRYIFGAINTLNLSMLVVSGPDGLSAHGPHGRSLLKLPNGLVTEEWPTLEPSAALFLKFKNTQPTPEPPSAEDAHEQKLEFIRSQRGAKPLSVDEIPLLITFKDIKDPTTAELVDPRHMDQVFGPGVSFRGATVELVDDTVSVSTDITEIIPWLTKNRGERIGPTDICGRGELCIDGSVLRLGVK